MFEQYKDVLTNLPSYSKNIFRKGYFSFLIKQMKSWSKFSWGLIGVNFIIQILLAVQALGVVPLSHAIISFVAANLSVTCVIGIANRSAIQGWAGAVSAIFIALNAFLSHNFADMTLQIFYFLFLDLFCILSPDWNKNITVHSMSKKAGKLNYFISWIKYVVAFVVIWFLAYQFYGLFNDPRLFFDSLVLAISLMGAICEFNLLREQWIFWLLSSGCTIGLWYLTAQQGASSYALFASYIIFLINDIYALVAKDGWLRSKKIVVGYGKKQKDF